VIGTEAGCCDVAAQPVESAETIRTVTPLVGAVLSCARSLAYDECS
jgi:hypothetical protein